MIECNLFAEFDERKRANLAAVFAVDFADCFLFCVLVKVFFQFGNLECGLMFILLRFFFDAECRHLFAKNNIVGCREKVHEFKVLVDHTDLVIEGVDWRLDDDFFTVHKDVSCVREIYARKHIHKRRLAASVFAKQ